MLLGASGDDARYEPYLSALGSAPASDKIFAVSSYCPITVLEQADAAYEWQFSDVRDYEAIEVSMLDYGVERKKVSGTLSDEQSALAQTLSQQFPAMLNHWQLRDDKQQPLLLDEHGEGSFKTYVTDFLRASAQSALERGEDLSGHDWLRVEDGRVVAVDFERYAHATKRLKRPPAFDALDLSSGENELFGNETQPKRHFTAFAQAQSQADKVLMAEEEVVNLMNPMNFIENSPTSHYRIRVGSKDSDTSLAISAMLHAKLKQEGKDSDYVLAWEKGHAGDYDLEALFTWIEECVR
ncbi:MAG: subtype B tannase [Cardiobacteriaceae bacterium]|nr:subtype B tannase [Cardiobacteriaceae bacterium]